ncbi:hypothetical protein N7449_008467 [Penicillium cf. viridicatum]|uniref:Uncharacterized protein n=1 Tax=Penicillium cf. viridicatum TaxID=2972119 RepID=A0A9W9M7P6_9EURO|nr:hypothetical protein N7449_008467 [Penicillium cf. viridicatum]
MSRDGISFGWSWMWGKRDGAKPPKIPLPPAEMLRSRESKMVPFWHRSDLNSRVAAGPLLYQRGVPGVALIRG